MKANRILVAATTTIALALLTGCGESTEPQAPETGGQETKSVTESVKEATQPMVEEATKAVEQTATQVKEAATTAAADATAKANDMIANAKKLITETKYSEAMDIINQLKSMKLTPEQETLVADLKAQIEKAMSALSGTNAAGALNSLLKK